LSKPILLVLVGLPYSGKSTYRAKVLPCLVADRPTIVLSGDDFIDKVAAAEGKRYDEVWEEYKGVAEAYVRENFRTAVEAGLNIIWDQTNLGLKKRRSILAQAPGYTKMAVYFELDEETEKARRLARPERFIPEAVTAQMRANYVLPTLAEGFDYVGPSTDTAFPETA